MSKDDLKKDVPDTEHHFQLDVIGVTTKKRFLGDFTTRIPTIKDQCMSAKFEATLNGEYGAFLPKGVQNAHKKLSYLRFSLTEYPKFWRDSDLGYDLMDPNVIDAIYKQCEEFEDRWVKEVWGEEVPDGTDEEKEE